MLPVEVRIYPTYKVVSTCNMPTPMRDDPALIASATGTLLFRQFFMTVPDELLEASRIDGAGPFRFFKDTLLPLSVTTIAALFVIQSSMAGINICGAVDHHAGLDADIVTGIKKMLTTTDELAEWQWRWQRPCCDVAAVAWWWCHAAAVRARTGGDGK